MLKTQAALIHYKKKIDVWIECRSHLKNHIINFKLDPKRTWTTYFSTLYRKKCICYLLPTRLKNFNSDKVNFSQIQIILLDFKRGIHLIDVWFEFDNIWEDNISCLKIVKSIVHPAEEGAVHLELKLQCCFLAWCQL